MTWSKVLQELLVAQLGKKSPPPPLGEIPSSNAMFKYVRLRALSRASRMQSTPRHPIFKDEFQYYPRFYS
jgi:hypothetical protein